MKCSARNNPGINVIRQCRKDISPRCRRKFTRNRGDNAAAATKTRKEESRTGPTLLSLIIRTAVDEQKIPKMSRKMRGSVIQAARACGSVASA
jgi:hypothetical protein